MFMCGEREKKKKVDKFGDFNWGVYVFYYIHCLFISLCSMNMCFACIYVVYHMSNCYLRRSKEGIGSPGTELTDGYELPDGF